MSDTPIFVAPFVGGLNTEQSSITDLPTYTSDELNCTIYPEGIRGRRYGMAIERDGAVFSLGEYTPTSFQGHFWKNVSKSSIDFAVYLVDTTLHFYYANKPFSISKIEQTVDLAEYVTDLSKYHEYPVKFVSGAGVLMIVSKYLNPVQITYSFEENSFTVEPIDITFRDLDGVKEDIEVDKQPENLTPFHKYNLLNQGWTEETIAQFKSEKGKYPSNNLQWWIGKDGNENYSTERLLKHYFGNTSAPKGHYILSYFEQNRAKVSGVYAGTARSNTWDKFRPWKYKHRTEADQIHEFYLEVPNSSGTATSARLQLSRLFCKGGKNSWRPWNGYADVYVQGLKDGVWNKVFYEKHYFQGTGTGGNSQAEAFIMNLDNGTAYEKYRVYVDFIYNEGYYQSDWEGQLYFVPVGVTANFYVSIAEDGDPFAERRTVSSDRIADVAYMAGKFFYLVRDTVLFSQTVTNDNRGYDKCYQDADPTSEEFVDPLPTDGGYVKFQTMGDGLALKSFNRGVLVFGRDIVHGLISPQDGRFTATEFDTVELSRAGLIGPQSVVSVANAVYYWSPLGIFKIGVNQQTGSTMIAEDITQKTIQRFYNNLPVYAKENCRGVYDYSNNRIYWFYPTKGEDQRNLDGVLAYDLNYDAFYPMQISEGGKVTAVFETLNSFEVSPTLYLRADGVRVVAGDSYVSVVEEDVKYDRFVSIGHCVLTEDNEITFGDFNSREFIDWDVNGYDSYMVSRPITIEAIRSYGSPIMGTYHNKQVPILQTLFKRTEEDRLKTPNKYIAQSGAYLRMRWGWSLEDKSNRWDMVQNAYRPQKDFLHDEYVESRVHIRGRGKAYQVEIRNDSNKDFRLAGLNLLVRK